MASTLLTLGLLGLSAASPLGDRQAPTYPDKSTSKAFNLVVNVTDPTRDFTPSIQNSYINSIHVGAGLGLVGVGAADNNPRIFYQNGTATDIQYSQGTVISDGGTPPAPYGISLTTDEGSATASTAHMNGGRGTMGIGLTVFPEPYSFLYPETYGVCNESIPYYQGGYFLILKQFNTTIDTDGTINHNVPDECAPVRLFPECTELHDLPAGSISSHEYAAESECYKDVASIL